MCGVVAAYAAHGGLSEHVVAPGVAAQRHRGPNGESTWASPCGRVALGHNRLAVIDPATGAQPLTSAADGLAVVVNGEFYGYQQVRDRLRRAGRHLSTRSDSEIALHLYAEGGVAALRELRGEFAVLLWDARRGVLIAVRDRFGCKPLHYAEHAGRRLFASEARALFAMGVPARWDDESLADHLLAGFAPDRTLFGGVHQVPPGCVLTVDEGGARVRSYWDLDYPREDEHPAGGGPSAERIADLVRDAVHTREVADVPVAYHLSGGLDSGAVVAIAAERSTPTTFTVRFDDPEFDEGPLAAITARQTRARHHELAFSRGDHAERFAATITAGEMLQENLHGTARLAQAEMIRAHGFTVALAGEGGDELFAGYPQTRHDLRTTISAEARRRAESGAARLAAEDGPAHLRSVVKALGFVPGWLLDRHMTVTQPLLGMLAPDFADLLLRREPCAPFFDTPLWTGQLAGRSPYHQSQYLFCKLRLANYILLAERLDMAHGVEVRLPLLDHHLADATKAIGVDRHLAGVHSKPVLREALRGLLPAAVVQAGKKPFFAPPAVSDDRSLALLTELVEGPTLDAVPFVDPVRVRALVGRLREVPAARRLAFEKPLLLVAGMVVLTEHFHLGRGR
ncbi:asparagine synthase (glutamine-hydrolyzing) [Actinokineospora guangxiensis]|uniref:asparagine synthase (glutamine-hydrolyzing) n=1 Tax=Actinokineospora guangxiensis TaxID=1490288 RepID=A0ABW0EQ52_9PSEU